MILMILISLLISGFIFFLFIKFTAVMLSVLFFVFIRIPAAIILWAVGLALICTLILMPLGILLMKLGAAVMFG